MTRSVNRPLFRVGVHTKKDALRYYMRPWVVVKIMPDTEFRAGPKRMRYRILRLLQKSWTSTISTSSGPMLYLRNENYFSRVSEIAAQLSETSPINCFDPVA